MTLVSLGLLLGVVGLLWVMVIDINHADHQTKRESPRAQDKPLAEAARCESKAADRVSVRQVRQNVFLYGSRAVNNQETLSFQVVYLFWEVHCFPEAGGR